MLFLCFALGIIFSSVVAVNSQNSEISPSASVPEQGSVQSANGAPPETTTVINAPDSIEILLIYVPAGQANAVRLIWGHKTDDKLNFTYGIHYGIDEAELEYPKNYTTDLTALVEDLEYCTKYLFAISANSENKINANNIRGIITEIDRTAAPEHLDVDFDQTERPCLLIRWSASCANIREPLGYIIYVTDLSTERQMNITSPPTTRPDYVYPLKMNFDRRLEIQVSTDHPDSEVSESVTYRVPSFLQPHKVRITSNPEVGFLLYWHEPFVPYYIGKYYYEIYVYKGASISSEVEKFYVTRPLFTFSGEDNVYTFVIGFVSNDQRWRSALTNPIVATTQGVTTELNIGFSSN